MGIFRVVALAAACAAVLLAVSGTAGGAGVSLGGVKTTEGFAAQVTALDAAAPYGAFVQFNGGTRAEHDALLARHGLTTAGDFHSTINAVFAVGTVAGFRALTFETAAVKWLEEDRVLQRHGDTAVWATRARAAQEWVSGGPFADGTGRILDGNGVGVAIIDSGINAAHPDLEDRVAKNYKIVCPVPNDPTADGPGCLAGVQFVDVGSTNSDVTSGHGTHVAGIVAGDGRMSTGPYPVAEAAPNIKGTFTGVAPGATLFGYSTGEVIAVFYAMEAWQHIYENFDSLRPRIRVANHSFGDGPSSYDPNSVTSQMVNKLTQEKGITMVFSAGNDGTTGDEFGNNGGDITSSYCDNPTPGVICVANYDDAFVQGAASGNGYRDGWLNASSSRGKPGEPATYPDISAPGTWYTAACIRGVEPVCAAGIINEVRWGGFYGSISGTSMSAPHIAGIAALLLNARPDLTPADVENVLQDTAYKFRFAGDGAYEPDPQNSGGTTSHDKGAGLADVPAALKALNVRSLATGGSTSSAAPTVAISSPANGATLRSGDITVTGTANDGSGTASSTQPVQWIADGDGGDYELGAADVVGASVQETAGGLTYSILVRDAADLPSGGLVQYRIQQNVNGRPFVTQVNLTGGAVAPSGGTAAATSASLNGNTITFFVPYANVGNPPANSPAHNVVLLSYVGAPGAAVVLQDFAPSANPSVGLDFNVRPMMGKPYTIARPQAATTPGAATVKVQLDNQSPVNATVNGSSPSYSWTAKLRKPKRGAHTIKATLYLGGVETATSTVSITIK